MCLGVLKLDSSNKKHVFALIVLKLLEIKPFSDLQKLKN